MGAATELAERISKAFNDGDVQAFIGCFAEDAIQEHPFFPGQGRGREELLNREGGMFAAFGDITYDVRAVVEQAGSAVIEAVVSATNTGDISTPGGTIPATGKRVTIPMASVVRLDGDGRIAEEHRYMDVAGFLRQLGVG
jgi:steroid delta-isomerase-like uncharacterized protein